jgi:hypothetical protein
MSKLLLFIDVFLVMLFFTVLLPAQVPNSGFESWTTGAPVSWGTNNFGGIIAITQSTNSHSGSSAARGAVAFLNPLLYPAYLFTEPGFTISQRYNTLNGFYQFYQAGGADIMMVWVDMFFNLNPIGTGLSLLPPTAAGYTSFSIPIQYSTNDVPDECYIYIYCGDSLSTSGGTLGTYFLVDDLSLSLTSGIDLILDPMVPADISLKQNYPNPFNPSTSIEFSLPRAENVSLTVYNSLGQEVDHLLNGDRMAAGTYRLTWNSRKLSSGIYIYQLSAGSYSQTRKMILLR